MEYGEIIQKQLKISFLLSMIFVICLSGIGFWVLMRDPVAGGGLLGLALLWLFESIVEYQYQRKRISDEALVARFERGKVQTNLLKSLPIPYVQTTRSGEILWFNDSFKEMMGSKEIRKNISQIFSGLKRKSFPHQGTRMEFHILFGERRYSVKCNSTLADITSEDPEEILTQAPVLDFYFFDETQLFEYREAYKGKNLVAGLIYIDNFEEVTENMEEVRQSLLLALIERKVVKYMHDLNAIIKKFERDKFFFVFDFRFCICNH